MQMTNKTAIKFMTTAMRLKSEVNHKRAPRQENTPKRQREAASARIEGDRLERTRVALEMLAEGHENGTLSEELAGIKNKAEVYGYLSTRIDTSGYYTIRDSGIYHDTSKTAVALRAFIEANKGAADRELDAKRAKADRIQEAENKVRFSQIPGFFPTPRPVIDLMLEAADIRPGQSILEPSAGKGDIADAILEANPTADLVVVEFNETLKDILELKGYMLLGRDFLSCVAQTKLDRIVMNPPFEGGQDIDHVRHAYSMLAPGGRLVSIMSTGPFFRQDKKSAEFRDWLESVGGEVRDLSAGSFGGIIQERVQADGHQHEVGRGQRIGTPWSIHSVLVLACSSG